MRRYRFTARTTLLAAALSAAGLAQATNGYFPHGYGIKAKGMGGAATATASDSLGGATNPAKMVFAGARADLGLEYFSPHRDAERSGALVAPTLNGKVASDKTGFLVPEFGYNTMLSRELSLGVSVYGNGGMNTTYPQGSFNCGGGPANMLCGGGTLGVDLMQLVVAPTVAWKLSESNAIGASLLLGYQRFKAAGIQAFDNAPGFPPFTGGPGSVTNNGYDSASGSGLRLGWMGRMSDALTLGAAWSSKVGMGRFDKYKGLFAGQGDFDIPSHYGVGLAFAATPSLTVALDAVRINYSDVPAVSNPSANQAPLGADNGPGFGWKDIDVWKFGVEYAVDAKLTLRAGYNRGENPVDPADVTFNILAPGVIKDHYTVGATWKLDAASEITFYGLYAAENEVTGASLFVPFGAPPTTTERISLKEYTVGVGYTARF